MSPINFNRSAYLKRINYNGTVHATEKGLIALHHAHLYTIAFENFDVWLGKTIDLEPEKVFDKLVLKNRGGYCFELNGLFLMALKSFGFRARALLARVHLSGTPSGRGHQLTLISFGKRRWIADVGFGSETPRTPLLLERNQPVEKDGQTVRLVDAGYFGFMLQILKNENWVNLYSFSLGYVYPGDIAYGNHYASTHPDSMFTRACVAAIPIEKGVVTLFNKTLTQTCDGTKRVIELGQDNNYFEVLKSYFGIDLEISCDKLRQLTKPETSDARLAAWSNEWCGH